MMLYRENPERNEIRFISNVRSNLAFTIIILLFFFMILGFGYKQIPENKLLVIFLGIACWLLAHVLFTTTEVIISSTEKNMRVLHTCLGFKTSERLYTPDHIKRISYYDSGTDGPSNLYFIAIEFITLKRIHLEVNSTEEVVNEQIRKIKEILFLEN